MVGIPKLLPASRFDVALKPAMYAAIAAATAEFSPVLLEPISETGLDWAAVTILDAALATAES